MDGEAGMDALILTVVATSVPLLLAATGELVAERSGVLNLGVEGMMLIGAVAAIAATLATGNPYAGVLAGAAAGALAAMLFAFLTVNLATNQVATGLALTIFATGLSGLIGAPLVGRTAESLAGIAIPLLSSIPVVGAILFRQDLLFYVAVAMLIAVNWMLFRTRWGMVLRAVGDAHDNAHALGYSVALVRWLAVCFGGMMAGLGGAYLPLVITPHWSDGITAGRGWIALALVVFASWMPWRLLAGALVFGGITILQLTGQARGWALPPQFLSMMPYVATILALVLISVRVRAKGGATAAPPACLGKPFGAGIH